MGTVYPLQYCSWVWPKTATIYLHFMFLDYLSFNLTAMIAACNSNQGIERSSSVPLCIFQWQKLSQLSIFLTVNLDRPLQTTCLQMLQQSHEVQFYPSLCWSIFYRCLFQLQLEVVVPISENRLRHQVPLTSLSQCCPLLVQMPFRSPLMWTLNGASNTIGSNTEDTSDRIFLWVIGASTSLLAPRQTWRLSSVTVHCSPSTEDLSVLDSTSTCFVLLFDFESIGIALQTSSLLLIHFVSGNLCCERRCCNWLKTSIASSGGFYWFDEFVHVKAVLYCFWCNWITSSLSSPTRLRAQFAQVGELVATNTWR